MRRLGLLCIWIWCLGAGACFDGGAIVDKDKDTGGLAEQDGSLPDADPQDAEQPVDTGTDGESQRDAELQDSQTQEDVESCQPSNGGVELCDALDNDCDGEVDEDFDLGTSCSVGVGACESDGTYVCAQDGTTECNATPGTPADEVCSDGVDNDCDGETDEEDAPGAATWYADSDGDGYGDAAVSTTACEQPADYVANDTDCDDTDAGLYTLVSGWADQDGDGYTAGSEQTLCTDGTLPDGYVASERAGDCDDADASANPSITEVCDGKDNNCDGTTDESTADDAVTWYVDCDGDGFAADTVASVLSCDKPTVNPGCSTTNPDWTQTRPTSQSNVDCNDDMADAFPGQTSYFSGPMTGANYNEKWDYDCDGYVDKRFTSDGASCGNCGLSSEDSSGWVADYTPSCGQTADYQNCSFNPSYCNDSVVSKTQECH
ncbi:hypothetical protein FIV42_03670 [Persicimonas caeni]|uniref:Uncharacterized protein n=1 Tax=Persicimonas caeni TaxID=2292766 RepID=A0A4Y6PP39_PERCE|nr:putative metal-binding motif-containing protein [Persicimonas caeni]QDG49869.1 hypothetical protein FIV42_03670 [Persicimonas caeni]QED31090.1 hypothetical protein FRD00_03665 [Persicimonas caeni]